jgi:hypothetical protein
MRNMRSSICRAAPVDRATSNDGRATINAPGIIAAAAILVVRIAGAAAVVAVAAAVVARAGAHDCPPPNDRAAAIRDAASANRSATSVAAANGPYLYNLVGVRPACEDALGGGGRTDRRKCEQRHPGERPDERLRQ